MTMSGVLERATLCMAATLLAVLAASPGLRSSVRGDGASDRASTRTRVLAFIVNKSNQLDGISSQDLRKVFLGERSKWPDGHKITLVMQEQGGEEREVFLRLVFHMSERDYNRYMLQAAFTGKVQSGPRLLSSAAGVVKFVSFVPGAIGYIYADETDASIKVIKVDGLAPGQAGYKFTFNSLMSNNGH